MHSSMMRSARLLTISRSARGGGWFCPTFPPQRRHPWTQTSLLDALDADPPGCRFTAPTPPDADSPGCRPPLGCRSPLNRMTHRCKNITLAQILFAGGKNHCMTFITLKILTTLSANLKSAKKRAFTD